MKSLPISSLPNECLTSILFYLGRQDLLKARKTCQHWNQLILDNCIKEVGKQLTEFCDQVNHPPYQVLTLGRRLLNQWKSDSDYYYKIFMLYKNPKCPTAMRLYLASYKQNGKFLPVTCPKEKIGQVIVLKKRPKQFSQIMVPQELLEHVTLEHNRQFAKRELVVIEDKGNLAGGLTSLWYGLILRSEGPKYKVLKSSKITIELDPCQIGKILDLPKTQSLLPESFNP